MADKIVLELDLKNKEAQKGLEQTNDSMEELSENTDKTNESAEELQSTFTNGFKSIVPGLEAMSTAQKALNVAVGTGGTGAFKALKVAIAATGIGALILAITSLLAFFTKTKRGAELLERAMAGLGAATAVITDLFSSLGEGIINAFENPQQAIKDFADTIKKFVTDRVEDIIDGLGLLGTTIKQVFSGEFAKAGDSALSAIKKLSGAEQLIEIYDDVADSVGKVTDEITKEAKEAARLTGILQSVRDAERELNVERAQSNLQIEQLKLLAEDVTKSTEERAEAAQKAFEIENDITNRQLENKKRELQAVQALNAQGESLEEDLQREADLKIQLAELEAASFTKRIELNNKINALNADALRKREEEAKRQIELQNQLSDLRTQAIEDEAERERAILERTFQDQIDSIKGNTAIEIELRKELTRQKNEALIQFDKEQEALKREQELTDAETLLQAELIRLELENEITTDKEIELENARFQRLLEVGNLNNAELELATAEHEAKLSEIEKKEQDKRLEQRRANEQAVLSVQQSTFQAIGALGNALIKDQEKAIKFNRDLALAQIAIDTGVAIAGIVRQVSSNPLNSAPPAFFADLAARSATVLTNVATAINTVKSANQQIAQLNTSGGGSQPQQQQTINGEAPRFAGATAPRSTELTKVFVTEEDISDTQERVNVIEEQASFV